jgi:hypothetical protein
MNDKPTTSQDRSDRGRRARGFLRAGGLIEAQLARAAGKRGFAQARLRALWPDIAGPEFAAISAPVKLTRARGPAGGLLTLAVSGAHAPQVQMLIPVLRERVNAALGPGTVGRIQLTHAPTGFAEPAPAFRAAPDAPPPDLAAVEGTLSSIGDGELRSALETLARNVVIRTRNPKH